MKRLAIILTAICLWTNCAKGQTYGSKFWFDFDLLPTPNDPTMHKELYALEILTDVLKVVNDLTDGSVWGGTDKHMYLSYLPAAYISIKDNGYETYRTRKIKFKEFFGNSYYFVDLGWKWNYTGLCPYISLKYRWQNFNTKFISDEEERQNKIRTFIPGIGVRMPFANLKRQWDWAPVIEIGSECNFITKYKKGIYGTDKNQLNNKNISTSFGLGVEIWNIAVIGNMFFNNSNLFNQNYSPDGGYYYPYANIETNEMYFRIDVSYYLGRH